MVVEVDLQPMSPGFESRKLHDFFLFIYFFMFFLLLLLQCKFAISTLLPLLSFSYFMTPYDAQAASAFSALICQFTGPNRVFPFQKQNYKSKPTIFLKIDYPKNAMSKRENV